MTNKGQGACQTAWAPIRRHSHKCYERLTSQSGCPIAGRLVLVPADLRSGSGLRESAVTILFFIDLRPDPAETDKLLNRRAAFQASEWTSGYRLASYLASRSRRRVFAVLELGRVRNRAAANHASLRCWCRFTKNIYAQGVVRVPGHSSACSPARIAGSPAEKSVCTAGAGDRATPIAAPIVRRSSRNLRQPLINHKIRAIDIFVTLFSRMTEAPSQIEPLALPSMLEDQAFVIR